MYHFWTKCHLVPCTFFSSAVTVEPHLEDDSITRWNGAACLSHHLEESCLGQLINREHQHWILCDQERNISCVKPLTSEGLFVKFIRLSQQGLTKKSLSPIWQPDLAETEHGGKDECGVLLQDGKHHSYNRTGKKKIENTKGKDKARKKTKH